MLVFLVASAMASFPYPAELQSLTEAPCELSCTVCHETLAGGAGTVTQPFGQALQGEGLTGGSNVSALGEALDAVSAAAVDSDNDGQPDADELAAGIDPNPGGEPLCDGAGVGPTFGCLSHTRHAPALVLGLLSAMLVARRRQR